MSGHISWSLLFVVPPLVVGLLTFFFTRWHYHGRLDQRYLDGLADGERVSTATAEHQAVEAYKLELRRRMHDSGRRTAARPDAETSRIHRVRVARPNRRMPPRPN